MLDKDTSNNLIKLASVAILLYGILFPPQVLAKGQKNKLDKVWIIDQHSKMLGNVVLFVSNKALRIRRKDIDCSIQMKANNPRVVVFNELSKKFATTTIRKFASQEDARLAMLQGYLEDIPMKSSTKNPSAKISGVSANCFTMVKSSAKKTVKATKNKSGNDGLFTVADREIKDSRLWTSKEIPITADFQKLIHAVYKLPSKPGIPLKMTTVDKNGKASLELKTENIECTGYKQEYYKLPSRLVPTASYIQVLHSGSNLNNLMNYFDIMHQSGLGK